MEFSDEEVLLAGENEYEVENIVGLRYVAGERQFLVRWKGFPMEHDTWEPDEHLKHCQDLIKSYTEQSSHKDIIDSVDTNGHSDKLKSLLMQKAQQVDILTSSNSRQYVVEKKLTESRIAQESIHKVAAWKSVDTKFPGDAAPVHKVSFLKTYYISDFFCHAWFALLLLCGLVCGVAFTVQQSLVTPSVQINKPDTVKFESTPYTELHNTGS